MKKELIVGEGKMGQFITTLDALIKRSFVLISISKFTKNRTPGQEPQKNPAMSGD